MSRIGKRLWRKMTALLLAVALMVPELGVVSAAAVPADQDPLGKLVANAVMNAVYGIKPVKPKAAAVPAPPLTWNVLTKLNRGMIPLIYQPDFQQFKLSGSGQFIGFKRMLLANNPVSVKPVITVYDRVTGIMDDIQVPAASLSDEMLYFDMSADARYVAFTYATERYSMNPKLQVYLFDREERRLIPITEPFETSDSSGESNRVSISDNGNYVVFDSDAKGLVPDDNDEYRDVFLYNRAGNSLTRISSRAGMQDLDSGSSEAPSISGDGRYIAFQSEANLTGQSPHIGQSDIYVYDRLGGGGSPFERISVGTSGEEADGPSTIPSISSDGLTIAFESYATNLVDGTTNGEDTKNIFVYNRTAASIVRVSLGLGGIPFTRDSLSPSISDDGRYVGFHLDSLYVDGENDIPEEAYVADVAAQAAYKITVQNAPYRLVGPSMSPAIGSGGKLVVYSSDYLETFGGSTEEDPFPGIFIAALGSAPSWPAGSKLEATNRTDTTVTLSWQNASDAAGILGYHVYKDGENIGYAPFAGEGGYTFTATGLIPMAEHVFQVEAVNAEYIESFGGPTHKLGHGGENPGGTLRVSWDADNMRFGMVLPGSKLSVTAVGEPGKRAAAELEYTAWKDEASQETRKAELTLDERAASPGTYGADWALPDGVSQLTSLTVKLTDPAKPSEVKGKQADGLPIQVAGTIVLGFVNRGDSSLAGSVLSVMNGQYVEQVYQLPESDSFAVNGLYPGRDYSFILRSPDYRHMWGKLEQVQTEAGKRKKVDMNIEQPAKIRFQVVDPTGMPVSGVRMELSGPQQQYPFSDSSGSDGWSGWMENLKAGDQVVAKFDIGELLMEPVPNQEVLLKPGANEQTIRLKAPDEGIVRGRVKSPNGEFVSNALVTSTQTYRGQQIVRKAWTNLDGEYVLSLLKGEARLEAYESSYEYSTNGSVAAQVTEGQTTVVDIPVFQPSRGVINLEVRLKYLEDTEYGEPVDMEQMGMLTRLETQHRWMTGYFQNAYQFHGSPGDQVSVCVTGTVPAYMTTCTQVTLDSNANATAKLYLEEKGARIQGQLAPAGQGFVSGWLYKMENGRRTSQSTYFGEDNVHSDGKFNINVPEAGAYVMELSRRTEERPIQYHYANVQFTVADKQILSIGTVNFSERNVFANYSGNTYDVLNSRIAPGETVTFKAGYKNGDASEAENVTLLFDIPEGTAVVKDGTGRLVVSGLPQDGEAALDGQTLSVKIGLLAKKQSGTVGFQIKADPTFNQTSTKSSARIRATIGGKQVEETIGTVLLDAPLVTIEAPERVYQPQLAVSGVAPKQSVVKIYDGGQLLGSTTAASNGYWVLQVELLDLGDPGMHALRAEVEANGLKLQSLVSYVNYDTKKPRLLEMAMAQAPEGKWITIDTKNGISNPFYTVVPGNPFQFELKFDKPDKVENAYVYLDGQAGEPVKAVRDGGVFRAFAPTNKGALGNIYVDFESKPEPLQLDGKSPTMDEVRASLPLTMRDFKAEVTSPFELKDGKYSGTVKLTFPQLDNMTMTVTLRLEPNANYSATSEEIALAERSGVPMYNSSFTLTETEDGFNTVSKGYMPMSVLFPQGLPAEMKASLGGVKVFDADPVFAAVVTESYVQFGPDGDKFGTFNSVKSQYDGMKGFAEKVNKITYKVQAGGLDCLAELPRTAKQAGKALVSLVGGEVAKFGLGAWTAAMGLSGPGAIAAAGTSAAIGAKIDGYVDQQIDAIGTGYNQCLKEDVDPSKRKRYKIARPRWIYDPSGYIYEAVPENRLSGVKATVLYLDPDSKQWTVWDARPYEQVNPHQTDDRGKYGWDVPEGKWKVVWEKAGYATQTSAELDVPPPHTEVNAGLVSWEAPKVQTVTGVTYAGGSYVDIEFTKYVKVQEWAIPSQAVTVTGPDGRAIEGTVAFVSPVNNPADPDGADLSRVARFTPKAAVTVGDGYTVKVNPNYFQSYSGVWMNEGFTGAFAVRLRDERGPEAISASVEAEGRIVRLTFDENLAAAVDSAKFTWNASSDLIASVVKSVNVGDSRTILITLTEPMGGGGTLTVLPGAVFDAAGNGAVEKSLQASRNVLSDEARLNSLSIEEGMLSPAFDPEKLSYSTSVPLTAEQVSITATTAHPKAKLVIDGVESVSGVPKTVIIPDNGEIAVRVIAEDGATVREYSIGISRSNEPDRDAALSGLAVTPGTLAPAFDPAKLAYEVEVSSSVTTLQVTATASSSKAQGLTINGAAVVSGAVQTVTIPASGLIEVVVTAADGTTKMTYSVRVKRTPGSSNQGGYIPAEPALTKAEPFTARNGGSGLRSTLQSDAIAKALQTSADGKKQLTVDVTGQADEYVLQLPANVLEKLKNSKAEIIFKTKTLQALLPWEMIEAAQVPSGASISFGFGAAPALEEKAAFEAAASQSGNALNPVGHAIVVILEVNQGKETTALAITSAHPIILQLPVNAVRQEAIYRLNGENPTWTYVWGQTNESGSSATIEVQSSGTYAVMAYKNPFADIAGHWGAADIGWMGQRLLVNGAAPGSFLPDQTISRAEFATMLVRALGLEASPGSSGGSFEDVSNEAWYSANVRAAAEAGLINGVTPERFEPNALITREQMAVMVWRAYAHLYKIKGAEAKINLLQKFSDRGAISEWAREAVALCIETGLILGTEPDFFDSLGHATRAQAAAIMKRLLHHVN
ncbi:cadherin-like beta sandwich domain-containing protein [Paenibacillus sp. GCM10012303]|uniref:cadherin-like beta sandwich domain-containing protein n=1 Tax=Paenibacillus sp. GCM10012303 TaxID=3317340 RepID=UPI00360FD24B